MPDDEINSDTDDDEEERLADTLLGDSFQDDGDSDGDSDGDDEDFEESNLIPVFSMMIHLILMPIRMVLMVKAMLRRCISVS